MGQDYYCDAANDRPRPLNRVYSSQRPIRDRVKKLTMLDIDY
jgi:hypothetical protein